MPRIRSRRARALGQRQKILPKEKFQTQTIQQPADREEDPIIKPESPGVNIAFPATEQLIYQG
ncbi:MAG: hypothetical protein JSW54_10585, partial [Fidelibacterota bacterium]